MVRVSKRSWACWALHTRIPIDSSLLCCASSKAEQHSGTGPVPAPSPGERLPPGVGTKSSSVPIPKRCAIMIASVLPTGEPASIRKASRWLTGRPIPARLHNYRGVRGGRRGDVKGTLSAPPSARLGGAARTDTMEANATSRKPGAARDRSCRNCTPRSCDNCSITKV